MDRGMTLRGISWYVPERFETNEFLVQEFGTWTPEKIFHKTGIRKRHIADAGKTASYYHALVANRFFEEHPDIARDTIDMLVVCTETRDYIAPATACVVHSLIGLRKTCGAVDYELGCSGYLYGLGLAKGFITSGIARRVLLVTGDVVAKYANKQDKSIRTLFGDGFTATLLEASATDRVTGFDYGTDGTGYRDIIIEAGAEAMPYSETTGEAYTNRFGNTHSKENIYMDGRKVLEFSVGEVPGSVGRTLERAGLKLDDIDLVVFHQASQLLLERVRDTLGVPPEKYVIDMADTGNTVSSTVPIALARAVAAGRLKAGMKVLVSGFGVGLSWGTAVIEWAY